MMTITMKMRTAALSVSVLAAICAARATPAADPDALVPACVQAA